MTLILYHNPVSTCSQKVRLVLAEKRLEYEGRVIDWGKMEHLTDEYLDINPNGVVPSLVHDGRPIVDSSVICEYLEEVFPSESLAPQDALGRAEMRAWMRYFEEVPTTAIRVPSFNMRFQEQLAALEGEVFDDMTARMPLRKHLYQEMGQSGFSDHKFDESLERLRSCIDRVSTKLKDGRNFLLGEHYSIADIVLVPTIIRMIDLKLEALWEKNIPFQSWVDRVMARPSFATAYYEGTRL